MAHDQTFKLPTLVSILFLFEEGRCTAHNLDFDLAVSGKTMEEATELIKLCTKAHVEYALDNGLEDQLYRYAPPKYWEIAEEARPLGTSEVIYINDRRKRILGFRLPRQVQIGIIPRESGHIPVESRAA